EETPGDEVLRLPGGAAVFDARRKRAPTAAVDADSARIVEGITARPDIEHAGGAQAELWRQRAGNQRHVSDQGGFEEGAEAADAVRKHDAVDADLYIGVLVAHVVTATGGGILRGSRKLQHDLLDRSVLALRQRLDGVVADCRRCRAGGCVNGVEALVEGRRPRSELLCRRNRRRWCRRNPRRGGWRRTNVG